MEVSCDIETDSLHPTLVHCISCVDLDTGDVDEFRQEECYTLFPKYAKKVTKWVFHNGIGYDTPAIARLLKVHIPLSIQEDTMVMSQLAEPDMKGGHSLAAYGERFKDAKLEHEDWSVFTEDMMRRCTQDAKLTVKVYKYLRKKLKKFSRSSLELEYRVKAIVTQQEFNGWPFDVRGADILVAQLEAKKFNLEAEVHDAFKPLPDFNRVVTPKRTKSGEWGKAQIKCLGHTHMGYVDGVFSLIDWPEFNLASRQQIAKHLIHHGWKPKKKTDKGSIIVDEAVLEGVDIPQAQLIMEYMMLGKRITQINSWIKATKNGKVYGSVITIGAISNRMAHHSPNLGQVPATYSPYGKECRSLFTSGLDEDYVLFGTDASGLELRCLAHYMNDPEYTEEILSGDIHIKVKEALGLSTRDEAKTFSYAVLYGAGAGKIGEIVGKGSSAGKKMIADYVEMIPAYGVLKDRVAKAAKKPQIVGLDGRLLKIRSPHSALNQLLQSAGAIICKQWLVELTKLYRKAKLDVTLVGSIHDEYAMIVHKDDVDKLKLIAKQAIDKSEEILKVKCPLDCDSKVGKNWSETH